jgi:hypothetical protein
LSPAFRSKQSLITLQKPLTRNRLDDPHEQRTRRPRRHEADEAEREQRQADECADAEMTSAATRADSRT